MSVRPVRGFTLIEMVIVVTLIAVLASIAIPSYRNYVVSAQRTIAKSALVELVMAFPKPEAEPCRQRTEDAAAAALRQPGGRCQRPPVRFPDRAGKCLEGPGLPTGPARCRQ